MDDVNMAMIDQVTGQFPVNLGNLIIPVLAPMNGSDHHIPGTEMQFDASSDLIDGSHGEIRDHVDSRFGGAGRPAHWNPAGYETKRKNQNPSLVFDS